MIFVMVTTSETGEFHPFDSHQYVVDEGSDIGRTMRRIEQQIRDASGHPDATIVVHVDGPEPDDRMAAAHGEGYSAGYRAGLEAASLR